MRIAVAGATGVVGAPLTALLLTRGHQVVRLSRADGVDLVSGDGLPGALDGVEVLVDVASVSTTSAKASAAFFGTVTQRLLDAEAQSGVGHHIALSIVGADVVRGAYYAGKVVQEQLIREGPVPWTILRATQFHEFARQIAERGRMGPLITCPVVATQPIAVQEVAVALADLAEGPPVGHVPDLAGPEQESLVDMVRAYGVATGISTPVVPVTLPGADARLGTQTFADWLNSAAAP
jgi:uncharacterized protein YbjT (DUF2867 family)